MTTAENDFYRVLIEQVSVPAYFEKIAADTGISPKSAEAANELRVLGDRVVAAVGAYQTKVAAALGSTGDLAIMEAAETARKVAGVQQPTKAASISDYLAAPGVYDAAVLAAQAREAAEKKAMGLDSMGTTQTTPAIPPPDSESDDEADKQAPAVAQ